MRSGMVRIGTSDVKPGIGPQGGRLMRSGMVRVGTSVTVPGNVFAAKNQKAPVPRLPASKAPPTGELAGDEGARLRGDSSQECFRRSALN